MRYGVVSPQGVVRHFVGIDLPGPRLPHDMAITERHSILMDLPLYNDPEAARHGRFKLFFDRDMPSRFGVIPRYGHSCELRWFEAAPCFIYHSVNAWEEGDEVVLDVCRVKQPEPRRPTSSGPLASVLSYLRLDAHMHRYRFNLRTGQDDRADDRRRQQRVPVDQQQRARQPSRFAYNMHISPESTLLFDGLMKYDVHTAAETHWFGEGRWGIGGAVRPAPGRPGRTTATSSPTLRRARGPLRGRGARRARRDRGPAVPDQAAGPRADRLPRHVGAGRRLPGGTA